MICEMCGDVIFPGELYTEIDGRIYHKTCAPKQKRIKKKAV